MPPARSLSPAIAPRRESVVEDFSPFFLGGDEERTEVLNYLQDLPMKPGLDAAGGSGNLAGHCHPPLTFHRFSGIPGGRTVSTTRSSPPRVPSRVK